MMNSDSDHLSPGIKKALIVLSALTAIVGPAGCLYGAKLCYDNFKGNTITNIQKSRFVGLFASTGVLLLANIYLIGYAYYTLPNEVVEEAERKLEKMKQ